MCKYCIDKTNNITGLNRLNSLRLYNMIDDIIDNNRDIIINNDNTIFACFFQKLMKQNIIRL